jgi:excisionase family DNA binding protein
VTERLLTAREVAELLGYTVDTIQRWTREEKLLGYRVSGTARGRLRYRESDIEALLADRATTAAPAREAPATRPDAAATRLSSPVPATPPRLAAAPTEEEPSDATR